MIARHTKLAAALVYAAMCLANAVAYFLHIMPAKENIGPLELALLYLAVPLALPLLWGVLRLVVRLFYGKAPLDPANTKYFDACLLMMTLWMCALDAYLLFYLPLTGSKLDLVGYNRMLLVVSGLFFIGFGNVVPKLPYQKLKDWVEIGPERTYRVNRIGGWIMVAVGAVETVFGLTLHLEIASFLTIFSLCMAAILVPYCWVYISNLRAYRREGGVI